MPVKHGGKQNKLGERPKNPVETLVFSLTKPPRESKVNGGTVLRTRINTGDS